MLDKTMAVFSFQKLQDLNRGNWKSQQNFSELWHGVSKLLVCQKWLCVEGTINYKLSYESWLK
jgi:hypothetical protein